MKIEEEMEKAKQFEHELLNLATKHAEDGLDLFLIKCALLNGVMMMMLKAHANDMLMSEAIHESYEDAASDYLDEYVSDWCDENKDKIDRIILEDRQRN